MTFLNLAELGIGTAIGFALYKPLFNNNHREVNQIINFVGNLYKKIGLLILLAGVLLSFFFPFIFEDTGINLALIYYAFFSFLASSLIGYFFNYHIFLVQADQKDYIVAKYSQTITICKILLQSAVVFFLDNFWMWITLEWITGVVFAFLIRKVINKRYPWLKLEDSLFQKPQEFERRSLLLTKVKQISVHKLGGFLNSGTDNILIFYFINAQSVAFFGNYELVVLNIGILIEKLFGGSKASIGNLVAENNEKSIHQVLWEMMALRFFIGGFSVSCILLLINPFIGLWLGQEYILDSLVVALFCSIFFLRQIVNPIEAFKQAYGLYSDTWAPITEGILNIVVSIIFALKFGLAGILLGTNVSILLIVAIWRPIYVYHSGFKKPFSQYLKGFIKLLVMTGLALYANKYLLEYLFKMNSINYLNFFWYALKIIVGTGIFYFGTFYLTSSYFRDVIKRLQNQFFN
ncbi:lipopolysaccharide biosynthesis protein [Maribacter aurantiacus]|uniref:Sugar transporter n=1 Tax=Maribacter aurantiacus TaxID=1882343 RepID=A0A5R8M4Q8_9FLAO|nr:sugar transporter [Maribacter aurantiacus]TLF44554.1 sugar transporter [Maribacter aurantiacus]